MEDEEYKKLPVEDRCVHKLWKARVNGYEEVTKLFRQIDDEKSPEFGKYLGLVKKFVVDSNAMGQEKGLEATLAFVENYVHAGKTVGEVMSGIITKCIAAPKTRTRELALQVTLMYVEIEKQDVVVEELIKGMDSKNPKIVSACINACTTALHEFGIKVLTMKPLVKKIPTLFADRDKAVRDEARLLAIEMYKWIGPTLRSQLNNLQPLQITELEAEFSKIEGQKTAPTRFIRSQQKKQAKLAVETVDGNDYEEDEEDEAPVQLDPYELADPVDILSKLPKDFFDKVEAKKWQDRKEALENLENLIKSPKLENGDYGDLVRALKKIVQKDNNVLVITLAAKCLAGLASGLMKRFQTYSSACVPALLEKFKEKKQSVVAAVRDAIDAVFLTTTIENILEDVLEALNNKNPSVKSETALFLARAFTKTAPAALNKKLLKALTSGLIKIINEPDPTVRDSSSEAVGTLMKLVGEKAINPFLIELEKDNLKMSKIKECCEKAVIIVKVPGASKKERPTTAPAKTQSEDAPAAVNRQVKRPVTAAKKKEISSGSATIVKSKSSKSVKPAKPIEKELSDEDVNDLVADILSEDVLSGLTDSNWKARLSAAEQMLASVQAMDNGAVPVQAIVKTVNRKPGLKDTNFQVLKARFDVVKYLATNCTFSVTTADTCLIDVAEKLGDIKNGATAAETLTAIAEATSLNHVSLCVMEFAQSQKSPKVLQEALNWLCTALKEFGFANLNAKALVEHAKKAIGSTNPSVRSSAIALFGVLYLYMGLNLHTFLENEKPMLREQINAEFDKYENEKPPTPIRGLANVEASDATQEEEEEKCGDAAPINVQDLLPRVDISAQITEGLVNELSDKNWRIRYEALTKLNSVIAEAKLIKPNIGDLPQILAQRLIDGNSKVAQTAFSSCEAIASAMGAPFRPLIRTFFPAILQGLGDGKPWIRTSARTCVNTITEQFGHKEFFEGEVLADALKAGSPTLRCEIWNWLAEDLPKIKQLPKEGLLLCVPHLFSNIEDRNADVRKNAQEAVLGVMIHLSYESMVKQTEKLKPGSKPVVLAALDKARPNLPEKPLPTKKQAASSDGKGDKVVKGGKPSSKNVPKAKVNGTAANKQAPRVARKKDDDVDTSPLLLINNMKHQRTIDESKLRVLKWNFTTPREEFVELLKEQMGNANVNKTLMTNMFHSDFRNHIKAIDSLMEDLPNNGQALISNLDLILKWLTLRFFDTNPSVLLKGLEYLHSVFNMLIETNYHMLETEASSFIPYLILKVGDPKDTVRNGVRSLFRQICNVYAVSKLFSYIMEGLKSKNARQRAECLEVLGSIIEDFGINVCLPSPAACLKEIAKQISDRDNAVRNAALNCVVQAYYIVGDRVYKMVGQISDKDMSLLEERIKRANKRTIAPPKATRIEAPVLTSNSSPHRVSSAETSPAKIINNDDNEMIDDQEQEQDEEEENDDLPQIALPPQMVQEPEEVSGPFRLDPDFLKELDSMKTSMPSLPQLQKFDLDFLKDDVVVPSLADQRAKVMPLSPPKPILPNQTFSRASLAQCQHAPTGQDILLEKTINQIGNPDIATALQGIEQMYEFLRHSKTNLMVNYEDQFMIAVTQQLKLLSNQDPVTNAPVARIYRAILTLIDLFYSNKMLGQKVSTDVLKDLMYQLVLLIAEGKLSNCPDGDSYIRVVNLHCVKAIERSDHTNIICGLIRLLHFCITTNATARFTDLAMKCLWRVIKIMKNWADEIDYDSVLLEVHIFLKDFPSSWWKNQQSDTALRTMKTVLHSMAKIKGGALMLHLGKIPNTNDSEIESYVLRVLKSLKIEEVKQVPLKTDSRRSLSRSTHTQLTEIFQKIGNKDETKDGLNLLYDFLQQHPEADIDPFLKQSSQFFQEYIQKNLKEIETARRNLPPVNAETKERNLVASLSTESVNEPTTRGPEYWRNRLQMLNKLWDEKMNKKE